MSCIFSRFGVQGNSIHCAEVGKCLSDHLLRQFKLLGGVPCAVDFGGRKPVDSYTSGAERVSVDVCRKVHPLSHTGV